MDNLLSYASNFNFPLVFDLVVEQGTVIWKGYELEIPLGIACLDSRKKELIISAFMEIIKGK